MSISEDDLLDIEDVIDKCSPGPWYTSQSYDGTELIICKKFLSDVFVRFNSEEFVSEEQAYNYELMGMSREVIPKLIKEIRELNEEIKKLDQQILEMS